jgi:hypothetical protein
MREPYGKGTLKGQDIEGDIEGTDGLTPVAYFGG